MLSHDVRRGSIDQIPIVYAESVFEIEVEHSFLSGGARFLYWSMTTSNYKIHFTATVEKVRPYIDICHLCCLRELLTEFRESRRMGSV